MEVDEEYSQPNNFLFFRLAVRNIFKHIAESVSEDEFLRTLSIVKSNPNLSKKLHEAMIKELCTSMNDDLEDVFSEGSLQKGLEKLAELSDANSSSQEDAWRPPGNVELHIRSMDAQMMQEETELLEKQVNEMESENAILMEKIAIERSKINAMHDNITWSINKSSIAIDLLQNRLTQLEKSLTLLDQE